MLSNEILTLQLGHYANFVGTHWWNIQEAGFQYDPNSPSEIDHDVLFREGLTLKNEVTFTPRLLLADLKGSLRTLSEQGELYKIPHDTEESEAELIQTEDKPTPNTFQKDLNEDGAVLTKKIYDMESEVKVWSDFLYSRFHPRTVNVIKQYQHSPDKTPFDIYPLGLELWKTNQFSEDFTDKIRNYIEECNSFQGFHILHDISDGFSGLTTSCLEYLNDDYNTKSILSLPVTVHCQSKNPVHLLNAALCFDALTESSSLFIPLSTQTRQFDFLSQKPELPYHSSAILASALDTITLTYRMKNTKHTLIDLCTDLSVHGRKGAAASVQLPFLMKKNEDFIDCLNNWEGPLFQTITPNCDIGTDENLQLLVLRGVPESRLKRPPHVSTKQRDMPAYRCETLKEMLSYYMVCTNYGSRTEVMVTKEQMPVKTPYPKFFNDKIDKSGNLDFSQIERNDVEKVNILAGVHSGKFMGDMFDLLSKDLEKINYKRFHQFSSGGVESDQFKECFDHILDLRDCYEDKYVI